MTFDDSRANFRYVAVDNFLDDVVIIRDVGPWDKHKTVTNDAEDVVRRIMAEYPKTKRIFYYDSNGDKDELKIEGGKFAGFAPVIPLKERNFPNG